MNKITCFLFPWVNENLYFGFHWEAEHLGLPYLSAYLDSIGANYRHGANFATGGSTILRPNETIYQYGISPFFLDMQISQFDQFKARTRDLYIQGNYYLLPKPKKWILSQILIICSWFSSAKSPSDRDKLPRPEDFPKALYTFDIGQNDLSVGFRQSYGQLRASIPDIVNKFTAAVQVSFNPFLCTHGWNQQKGIGVLITWIWQHLYQEGARTFWIHNTGPVGCLPVAVMYIRNPPPGMLDQYGCNKAQNEIAVEFNKQLKDGVMRLRAQLPQASITYVDLYAAKYGLISDAKGQGDHPQNKPSIEFLSALNCSSHLYYFLEQDLWIHLRSAVGIVWMTTMFGAGRRQL